MRLASAKYTLKDLRFACASSTSLRQVIEKLGLACSGANASTIKKLIAKHEISTIHFSLSSKSRSGNNLSDILVKDSPYRWSRDLKRRLVKFGLLKNLCYECGISEWRGRQITLQLDHINGDPSDNRLENLRILCPNCHSQTETWGMKKRQMVPSYSG